MPKKTKEFNTELRKQFLLGTSTTPPAPKPKTAVFDVASKLKLPSPCKSLRKAIDFYATAILGKTQLADDRLALVSSVLLKEVPLKDLCAVLEEKGRKAGHYTVNHVHALEKWYSQTV